MEILERENGVLIKIRAVAGARRNGIEGVRDGALRVAVTQVPEKGKANQAIIQLLARQWGLARSQLSVVSGSSSATKKVFIAGLRAAQLRELLKPWLTPREPDGT